MSSAPSNHSSESSCSLEEKNARTRLGALPLFFISLPIRVCCRKRRLTKASSLSQRLQQEQKSSTPKKILCLHFFSFLPHKVIVDRLTAVNKNVLTRTEFVRYRQEICPVCNFLGSRPALEWRFTHNLCPKLGIVHHTLI